MGSKGVVRRIKISSAAKLYIYGVWGRYMNCASLPPPLNPLNPLNPPNLTADFHSNGEGKEEAASPHLLEERLMQVISESTRACKSGAVSISHSQISIYP